MKSILRRLSDNTFGDQDLIDFEPSNPQKPGKYPFPTPCTAYQAVKQFIDLRGALTKKTVKNFAPYCTDPSEKEKMLELFASKDLFKTQITDKYIGLLGLFEMFKSLKPPLSALL